MVSPSSRRATKRGRSSITELALHGIHTSRPQRRKVLPMCPVRNATYVSGRSGLTGASQVAACTLAAGDTPAAPFEIFLHSRRALEFSHGQDPKATSD